jgi:hypothetical protein
MAPSQSPPMTVKFTVRGKTEKELRDRANKVMQDFVDTVNTNWKWTMEVSAVTDEHTILGFDGEVTAKNDEPED